MLSWFPRASEAAGPSREHGALPDSPKACENRSHLVLPGAVCRFLPGNDFICLRVSSFDFGLNRAASVEDAPVPGWMIHETRPETDTRHISHQSPASSRARRLVDFAEELDAQEATPV